MTEQMTEYDAKQAAEVCVLQLQGLSDLMASTDDLQVVSGYKVSLLLDAISAPLEKALKNMPVKPSGLPGQAG